MEVTREIVERNITRTILRLEKAYGVDFNKRKFLTKRLILALRSSIKARNNNYLDKHKWYLLEEEIIKDMLNEIEET